MLYSGSSVALVSDLHCPPQVPAAGTNAKQFIKLYRELIVEPETKYYLVVRHNTLMTIAGIISKEIDGRCSAM